MSTINIRISDDLREQLDRFCAERDLPLSIVVRESIRRYLAIQELRALRDKLVPHAEAQGVFTDEDVFRIVS